MKVSMVSSLPPGRDRRRHLGQVVLTNSSSIFEGRLAGGFELGVLREPYRQVGFRHGHNPAFITVNHGYRRAPVALAGDKPVTQTVAYRTLAPALRLQIIGDMASLPAHHWGGRLNLPEFTIVPRPGCRPRSNRHAIPAGGGNHQRHRQAHISERRRNHARREPEPPSPPRCRSSSGRNRQSRREPVCRSRRLVTVRRR